MKKILFILLLPFIFIGCEDDNDKTQKFLGMRGKPKSVKEAEYKAVEKFGEVIPQDIEEIVYYKFNKKGRIEEVVNYDTNKNEIYKLSNRFNNKGNLIERYQFNKISNTSNVSILKSRNSNNEVWENKTSNGETTISNIEIDNRKEIIKIKDLKGNIISKYESQTDEKGNLVYFVQYQENEIPYKHQSLFDENSRELKKIVFVLLPGSKYEKISPYEELEGIEKDLNEKKIFDTIIYTYTYETLDKKQNWTKKIEYLNGVPNSITIREIKY